MNGSSLRADFEVTLELDSRQKTSKRMFVFDTRQTVYKTHILLTQKQEECREMVVYLDVSADHTTANCFKRIFERSLGYIFNNERGIIKLG